MDVAIVAGSSSNVFVEHTSVPVPEVSVTAVALEEDAMDAVSSLALAFLFV